MVRILSIILGAVLFAGCSEDITEDCANPYRGTLFNSEKECWEESKTVACLDHGGLGVRSTTKLIGPDGKCYQMNNTLAWLPEGFSHPEENSICPKLGVPACE